MSPTTNSLRAEALIPAVPRRHNADRRKFRSCFVQFAAGSLMASVLCSQRPGAPISAAATESPKADRCHDAAGLAPISAAKSVSIEELDAWNARYFVRGDTAIATGAPRTAEKRSRSAWPEIDPRSTLIVRFGHADDCAPPFKVRLRGTVRKQSGSTRSLEIPRYFQAGVAQAEPQSRTFAWRSARHILDGVTTELAAASNTSRTTVSRVATGSGTNTSLKDSARDTLQQLRTSTITLELARTSQIESAALATVRAESNPHDTLANYSAVAAQRALSALTVRLDSVREAQSQLLRRLDASDSVAQVASSRAELRELLAVPRTQLAVRLLRQPAYAPALRELAAQLKEEEVTLDSLFARVDRALSSGDAALKVATLEKSSANLTEILRDAVTVLRAAQSDLRFIASRAALKVPLSNGSVEPLLLPDAEIPLRGSSVAEGEQVSLEVSFIATDGAILESATYEFSVIKLGGAVRNIRDVALFLNRCPRSVSVFLTCRGDAASTEATAKSIRESVLGVGFESLDLLRLDAVSRARDIPVQDRYIPVPGVVFEALFRPRVLESDNRNLRLAKKTIRALGLSAGVSVSFVTYTERRVTVNLPTVEQLRAYYSDTDMASRALKADTMFRLGSSDLVRQDLSIAPAVHIGLFDGAFSWAFGKNLRATHGKYFNALGFSFLGLTEAGAKLIGSIKAN